MNNLFKKFFKKNFFLDKDGFVIEISSQNLQKTLFFLKDHEGFLFKTLIDIFAIDFPGNYNRFCLTYCVLSQKYNVRARLKVFLNEFSFVDSISNIYKSACWMEREVWDMNGIFFDNHPDLRRILTDYGFEGFPLRKDFPLTGYTEVRYDDSQKRIISESIEMPQEYRVFSFKSSWE